MGDPPGLPSGVVTFLLTDVVGSTELWDRAPAAMETALLRHDELIGAVVADNGGLVLKARGEGDSTFSVFARVTDALRAAHAVQAALAAEEWPADAALVVRVALHSGEAVERDGDFLGSAVNRAARLRSLAAGGEVLVSGAVAELVADHLPAGMRLVETGRLQLRGLERPESTYALVAPGLPMPQIRTEASPLLAERGVSRREAEVLEALADRLTNAEIAARLYVSVRTVESHVSSLLRKLHAGDRLELGDRAKELAGSTRLVAPSLPSALQLLADPTTYIGRADDRDRLRALWRRASEGHMLVALVSGDAGMGKSRLVAELAAEVHGGGGRVLLGSCFEDLQLPYQPFAQALTEDASVLSDAEIRRRAGRSGAELGRIVPDLAAALGVTAGSEVVDTIAQRAEVFAALHGYLARSADSGPVLLVIEDLHWATATTRDVLRHVARVGGHAPVLVVVTTRVSAPDVDEALGLLLADLARLPTVEHLALAGLDVDEVAELVAAVGGGDPATVLAETGGNPLFVRELAGAKSTGSGASLSGLLARRYARIDKDALAILDMASVLGTEFDADLLAAAADRPLVEVLEALEQAEAVGLVAAAPGRPGRFGFAHALFRAARYEAISASRRLRLHQHAAWALRSRSEDDRVLPELARHACLAAPLGDARVALEYARRAAEAAERSLALEEAAMHYERAIEVADMLDPPELRMRLRLTIRLGEVRNRMGDPRCRDVLRAAAADARAISDPLALADIAWAMSQDGTPTTPGRSDTEFVSIAEDALAGLGPAPTPARGRTLAALAADLTIGGNAVRGFDLAQEALAIGRSLGDPFALGQVLLATRTSRWLPGHADAGHQSAQELVSIGRSTGQTVFAIYGALEHALAFREQGDLASYDRAIQDLHDLLDRTEVRDAYIRAVLICLRASQRMLAGELVAAEEMAERVIPVAAGGGFDPDPWFGPAIAIIRHSQGRLGERIRGLEVDRPGFRDFTGPLLAAAYVQGGRQADAHNVLRKFVDESRQGPRSLFWLSGMVLLCETAEATGDATAARWLETELEPFGGLIAGLFSHAVGTVDLALTQAALAAGDAHRAEGLAAKAVAASRDRETPSFLGRELIRLAAARRRQGSKEEISSLVAEALALADRTGADLIRHEAQRFELSVS